MYRCSCNGRRAASAFRAPAFRRPAAGGRLVRAEAEMLDVTHGLIDQLRHMHVIERIDDPPPAALTDDQPDVLQQPQLVRDGGLLHPDGIDQLRDRVGALTQLREDQHPARSRKPLHCVGNPDSNFRIHLGPGRTTGDAVAHSIRLDFNMSARSLNNRSCRSLANARGSHAPGRANDTEGAYAARP